MDTRTVVYHHAADLDEQVWAAFLRNEAAANLLYPFARRALGFPRDGDQHWVAYFEGGQATYIVSCTKGDLGTLPVFVFTVKSIQEREQEGVDGPLRMLAVALHGVVEQKRLFSVFAPQDISLRFSEIWAGLTNISVEQTPYYDAMFSFCTRNSFVDPGPRRLPEGTEIDIGCGEERHIPLIAAHCRNFSMESEPYVLQDDGALREATLLVHNNQVWTYMIKQPGDGDWKLAAIVAVARVSENVATITKVHTREDMRGQGCAARLLRYVVDKLLSEKERVVLYVGIGNSAAELYHRVGFRGMRGSETVEGVERWVEHGFDRQRVRLGHW